MRTRGLIRENTLCPACVVSVSMVAFNVFGRAKIGAKAENNSNIVQLSKFAFTRKNFVLVCKHDAPY